MELKTRLSKLSDSLHVTFREYIIQSIYFSLEKNFPTNCTIANSLEEYKLSLKDFLYENLSGSGGKLENTLLNN